VTEPQAYANTDREIWRKGDGNGDGMSYYEPSIHVTDRGNIGINVGGLVFVKPVEEWHRLANDPGDPPSDVVPVQVSEQGLFERACWWLARRCEDVAMFFALRRLGGRGDA
jgi:hypothetical protein